jgi:hypothetical protein
MRVERVAALKNDVMNLLRNQAPPPKGLTETLIAMFRSGKHSPSVLEKYGARPHGTLDFIGLRGVQIFV